MCEQEGNNRALCSPTTTSENLDDLQGHSDLAIRDKQSMSNPTQMRFDLPALIQPTANLDHLTDPFTKDEIDGVVQEMPADQAPGPDGFSGLFLKACW